jgi:thymidine kinase
MFAGKTEELIRRIKREHIAKRQVTIIKPIEDTRTEAFIASRALDKTGTSVIVERYDALIVADEFDLERALRTNADMIAFNEGQFLPEWVPRRVRQLLRERVEDELIVVVEGLDLDYRLNPFGPMPEFLAMADSVLKLDAICMNCHRKGARFTQRVKGSLKTIQPGDRGSYEVRCRKCHTIFTG